MCSRRTSPHQTPKRSRVLRWAVCPAPRFFGSTLSLRGEPNVLDYYYWTRRTSQDSMLLGDVGEDEDFAAWYAVGVWTVKDVG